MAAGIMPKLGEPVTCDHPCGHKDCEYWRKTVGSPCGICGEPISSGQRFYDEPKGRGLIHARCLEECCDG